MTQQQAVDCIGRLCEETQLADTIDSADKVQIEQLLRLISGYAQFMNWTEYKSSSSDVKNKNTFGTS